MKLTDIKGIGLKKSELLNELGVYTVKDLIKYMPKRYEDRSKRTFVSDASHGIKQYFELEIKKIYKTYFYGNNKTISRVSAKDESGEILILWHNNKFILNNLRQNERYKFFGYYDKDKKSLMNPIICKINDDKIGGIVPIYSIKKGLSEKNIINFKKSALEKYLFADYFNENILQKYSILEINKMYKILNSPKTKIDLFKAMFTLNVRRTFLEKYAIREYKKNSNKNYISFNNIDISEVLNTLEFNLTSSQNKALDDIFIDMQSKKQMNRIIIGDVGSGKTIVAILSSIYAVKNKYQVAFMTPTEILAIQHFEKYKDFLSNIGIKACLLIGSTSTKNKKEIYDKLRYGEIDIIFGTHSLFQEKVKFAHLGLVITDEQQRFGVYQRKLLNDKGESPDTLLLSATPIPRTLALSLFSDLDISFIDTMPLNRIPIKSYMTSIYSEKKFIDFAYNKVLQGEQAYIVVSRVEEDENLESIERLHKKLNKYFNKKVKLDYLHGQMSSEEKELKQKKFYNGEIDVLIATSIVEVGIDNPNATVMIIYDANQFGISQLHQIRGRVGRSSLQSYCFFVVSDNNSNIEKIKFIANTNDGFEIAKKDMELRGSGEMYSSNQSGFIEIDDSFVYNENLYNICDKILCENISNPILNKEIEKRLENLDKIILN